jgi:hypothetical protein
MVVGQRRVAYAGLMGKPEGKKPLDKRRCGWEDNIKRDLQEIERGY